MPMIVSKKQASRNIETNKTGKTSENNKNRKNGDKNVKTNLVQVSYI